MLYLCFTRQSAITLNEIISASGSFALIKLENGLKHVGRRVRGRQTKGRLRSQTRLHLGQHACKIKSTHNWLNVRRDFFIGLNILTCFKFICIKQILLSDPRLWRRTVPFRASSICHFCYLFHSSRAACETPGEPFLSCPTRGGDIPMFAGGRH